jgi:hypothetical protein
LVSLSVGNMIPRIGQHLGGPSILNFPILLIDIDLAIWVV